MESAIATHLVCPRSQKRRISDDYVPPYPAWTARGNAEITQVAMGYFGVQWRGDALRAQALQRLREIDQCLRERSGSQHHDFAHYVDEAGFDNLIAIAYWTNANTYHEWAELPEVISLWSMGSHTERTLGHFREIVFPDTERFETLFSTSDSLEGVGLALGERSVEDIQEHAYWGAMRDRLPLSQTDAMAPMGELVCVATSKEQVRVSGHANVALIRSGQDWTATKGTERSLYLENIEPVFRAGMDFLRDEGGAIGCYVNRYMTEVDLDGCPLEKTFGMSYWRSLADMESWAEDHPTHLEIFGSFMKTVQQLEFKLDLRLYHEVSVLNAHEQFYEYHNCHAQTGLMNAVAS